MIPLRCKLAVVVCGFGVCCFTGVGVWPAPAHAQAQTAPLGDVAREDREQKKQAPKAARVWTNDDLPGLSGVPVNVVGAASVAPSETAAAATTVTPAADIAAQEAERRDTETELAAAKESLGRARKELDLLQRDFNLQQQQHYSNPAYALDKAGRAQLDALAEQVKDKQEEVRQTEAKVAALQEKLEGFKRGAESKKPEPPSPPSP